MTGRAKRSAVWDYFVINVVDESEASCSICPVDVPRGGKDVKSYNTSNMRRHLETKHPEEFSQLQAKEKEEKERGKTSSSLSICGSSDQPTIIESFTKTQPLAFDNPRAKAITRRIGEMIVLDSEPFTVVSHTGFSRLLKILEPRYKLPSEKYFSETLIPEMYQKVCLKVRDLLSSISNVSVTTDIWSSVAQDSYLSLTCHYIAPDFTQQQVCLHAVPFNDHHTGELIGSMITRCLESWNLSDKLHVVVRDNGSNFVAGLRDAAIPSFGCLAHTLQLVVKDGCLAQPVVIDLTAKARKLVGHYKHSKYSTAVIVED